MASTLEYHLSIIYSFPRLCRVISDSYIVQLIIPEKRINRICQYDLFYHVCTQLQAKERKYSALIGSLRSFLRELCLWWLAQFYVRWLVRIVTLIMSKKWRLITKARRMIFQIMITKRWPFEYSRSGSSVSSRTKDDRYKWESYTLFTLRNVSMLKLH